MKKALFLINTFRGGGAEKVLLDTVNNLVTDNIEITVQTIFDSGIFSTQLNDKIKYKNILRKKSNIIYKFLAFAFWRILPPKIIYNVFIKDDYDYEIAFLEGFPTKIISNSTNKKSKKIAWIHTDLIDYPDSCAVFGSEKNERIGYSKFDSIACVSNGVKDSFIKKYGTVVEDIQTVYNIVDEQSIITFSKEKCDIKKQSNLIVSVGRLAEQKAFERLLRVQKRLNEENILSELWIVGEGEKYLELETFIKNNNLNNIKLLGFQKNPYKYMAQADIFVSSSIAEGYSTVITEAVILGIPVISTNTSGAYEPFENPRCSIVVEDEEELYIALKSVLSNNNKLKVLKNETKSKQNFFKKENLLRKLKDFLEFGD